MHRSLHVMASSSDNLQTGGLKCSQIGSDLCTNTYLDTGRLYRGRQRRFLWCRTCLPSSLSVDAETLSVRAAGFNINPGLEGCSSSKRFYSLWGFRTECSSRTAQMNTDDFVGGNKKKPTRAACEALTRCCSCCWLRLNCSTSRHGEPAAVRLNNS